MNNRNNSQIPCKNGRNCEISACPFLHNLKTKMCKFGDRCFKVKTNNCFFAHSEEELYVPMCRFKYNCNNLNCKFKHPVKKIGREEEKIKKNEKKLEFSLENFPQMLKVSSEDDSNVLNYKEMRNIRSVTSATIKEENITDILKEYSFLRSFEKVIIKL